MSKPVSYSDVMRELSNMVGEYFENIEDVEAYCAELRGGSDQNEIADLRAELAAKDAEIERMRAQWEKLLVEIEDLTGGLPVGKESLEDVVAAVKLMCDQRDYAIEEVALYRAALEGGAK